MFCDKFGVILYFFFRPLEIPCDRLTAVIRLDEISVQRQRLEIRIGVDDDLEFRTLLFDIVDDVVVVTDQLFQIEIIPVFCRIFQVFVRQIFLVFCEAVFAIAAVVVHVADVVHVDAADAVGSRAQNSIQFFACEGEIVVADEAFDFRVVERVDIGRSFPLM